MLYHVIKGNIYFKSWIVHLLKHPEYCDITDLKEPEEVYKSDAVSCIFHKQQISCLFAVGLPGPVGVLLPRGSAVPFSSSRRVGSAGARLHLDPPQPCRRQPQQPPTCHLPCRCDRCDHGPVEEKLAAESKGGCRHCSQRGREFQEGLWFHSWRTWRLQ